MHTKIISTLIVFFLFCVAAPANAEETYTLHWSLHKDAEGETVLSMRMDFAEGYFTYSHWPGSEFAMPLDLKLSAEPGAHSLPVGYPKGVSVHYDLLGADVMVHKEAPTFFIPLAGDEISQVQGSLRMLMCSKTSCKPVREKITRTIGPKEITGAPPMPADLQEKMKAVEYDPPKP
jgi:hypothetical protein